MDEDLRILEREALAGDEQAQVALEALRRRIGLRREHSGVWDYHDDDCRCTEGGIRFCNRDGRVWSCCGACKEDSECTAPRMHPTYWGHPKASQTHARHWNGPWPTYKSDVAIRAVAPELFRG